MISISTLYQKLQGRVNSHQGGHIKPSDFVNWVHEVQMDLYNSKIEEFQKTQKIADEITVFLESANVLVSNMAGSSWDKVAKPPIYENYASARIIKKNGKSVGCKGLKEFDCDGNEVDSKKESGKCSGYVDKDEAEKLKEQAGKDDCEVPIEIVDNDRWSAICSHRIKKVTCAKPKMTQYTGGFKISPKGCATSIIMDFFRTPQEPVYNFIIINENAENEYYQFVPAGSVNLEWSQQLLPDFITKLIDKYATFVGNDGMWQQAKVEQKDK